MTISDDAFVTLSTAIQNGSLPDSTELLIAEITTDNVSPLVAAITNAKDTLSNDIRAVSDQSAGDVEGWLVQARRLQDDIARCKIDARNIVAEHERVELMRSKVQDAKTKVQLLEQEILFSRALEREMETVNEIVEVLNATDSDLQNSLTVSAVGRLTSIRASLSSITAGQTRLLLENMEERLRGRAHSQLQDVVEARFPMHEDKHSVWFEILPDEVAATEGLDITTLEDVLQSLQQVDALSAVLSLITKKFERLLLPLFSQKSALHPAAFTEDGHRFTLNVTEEKSKAVLDLDVFKALVQFMHARLPTSLRDEVASPLVQRLVPILMSTSLDTAVPLELAELKSMDKIQGDVLDIAKILFDFSWSGHEPLNDWVDQIPRIWLTKRRARSLDSFRQAFVNITGQVHQVERIERQVIAKNQQDTIGEWDADWDDKSKAAELEAAEAKPASDDDDDDDDASGWDFDTESNHSDSKPEDLSIDKDEDDSGDAWGWGDESPTDEKSEPGRKARNLSENPHTAEQKVEEIVLKETYNVTDVPDYVLEVIGRDITDAHTLSNADSELYFKSRAPASALQALPTLTLAMFRATAPTYYSLSPTLSNMNLYNDTLYITQRLDETADPATKASLEPATQALSKFARQIYTRELETQRTILSDLLDGAQGFVSCTRFPYNQECTNAVIAVTDRIRQVHTEWKGILGQSHLFQSIGTLITMVMSKIIHDVLDMEDISEPESKQLVEHFQKIASLEDLFLVEPPPGHGQDVGSGGDEQQPLSTIALYVQSYLRFMYMINILDSSLADIKYMWTEGELKLEFRAEEVIDLIKALFAESGFRRSAINEIRQH